MMTAATQVAAWSALPCSSCSGTSMRDMWMGGPPPLGYDVRDKKLVINATEAEQVRKLFAAYLEVGSVKRRGVETHLILGDGKTSTANADTNLPHLVAKARRWLDDLSSGNIASVNAIAERENLPASEVSRRLPLAFLSPTIVSAILRGEHPPPSPPLSSCVCGTCHWAGLTRPRCWASPHPDICHHNCPTHKAVLKRSCDVPGARGTMDHESIDLMQSHHGLALKSREQKRMPQIRVSTATETVSLPDHGARTRVLAGKVALAREPAKTAARKKTEWWARQDSNLQPDGYEPSALTIELQAPPAPSRAVAC